MSLFKKNPNEKKYPTGKKNFIDVIKNTGDERLLAWRQPEEDFNSGSRLIVMPGEEAVFINGGVIEKVFENGTYTLSTQNYPFISRIKNTLTGGISAFNCVVYFVKKSLSVEVKWGTDSPIQVRDKKLGIATKLKARGSYKLSVDDAKKFITKMLGANKPHQTPEEIEDYFFEEFQGKIRAVISKEINEQEYELLGIDARLGELSTLILPLFDEILAEYGLKCLNFTVSAIDIDDDELREKYDKIGIDVYEKAKHGDVDAENIIKQGNAEAQVTLQKGLIEAQIMVAQGKAENEVLDTLGELRWTKQQAAEILKTLASNEGSGALGANMAGLGMGMAMGDAFASLSSQMTNNVKEAAEEQTAYQKLRELKEMLDDGLISEEEYNDKKSEILKKL